MGLLTFFGCSKREAAQPATPKFAELSREDVTRLEQQRGVVAAAKQRYGTASLTETKADLVVLQRLLDDHVFAKTQTYELQSLGIAFGDVLASELPLRWMMVTDEYGTDPTLRYKDTTIQINPLTMISKRIERGEDVDVATMLRMTGSRLRSLRGSFGNDRAAQHSAQADPADAFFLETAVRLSKVLSGPPAVGSRAA